MYTSFITFLIASNNLLSAYSEVLACSIVSRGLLFSSTPPTSSSKTLGRLFRLIGLGVLLRGEEEGEGPVDII